MFWFRKKDEDAVVYVSKLQPRYEVTESRNKSKPQSRSWRHPMQSWRLIYTRLYALLWRLIHIGHGDIYTQFREALIHCPTSPNTQSMEIVVGDNVRINVVTYYRLEYRFVVTKCCHRSLRQHGFDKWCSLKDKLFKGQEGCTNSAGTSLGSMRTAQWYFGTALRWWGCKGQRDQWDYIMMYKAAWWWMRLHDDRRCSIMGSMMMRAT